MHMYHVQENAHPPISSLMLEVSTDAKSASKIPLV
jgi:hypothetical protein